MEKGARHKYQAQKKTRPIDTDEKKETLNGYSKLWICPFAQFVEQCDQAEKTKKTDKEAEKAWEKEEGIT